MRRKVLKDFAHVFCQKFVDLPSGRDLAVFVDLAAGTVSLNILSGECHFGEALIERLETCSEHKVWLEKQMEKHHISMSQLLSVIMKIEFKVTDVVLRESYGHDFRHANFWFSCSSEIRTNEASYKGTYQGEKRWGYGSYGQKL